MDKRVETMPVIVEDEKLNVSWAILFNRSEAEVFQTWFCESEERADQYVQEFLHNGTITGKNFGGEDYTIEAFMVVKVQVKRVAFKQYRAIELPDEK